MAIDAKATRRFRLLRSRNLRRVRGWSPLPGDQAGWLDLYLPKRASHREFALQPEVHPTGRLQESRSEVPATADSRKSRSRAGGRGRKSTRDSPPAAK